MKVLALIPALLLAGCASHGFRLEDIGAFMRPRVAVSDAQAQVMNAEVVRLRTQAESIRLQLARENDRARRFDHYRELRRIGDAVVLLERGLAHRSSPATTVRPAAG